MPLSQGSAPCRRQRAWKLSRSSARSALRWGRGVSKGFSGNVGSLQADAFEASAALVGAVSAQCLSFPSHC